MWEVQELFKMMRVEAFLSYCVADRDIKDEDITDGTDDSFQSEIYVKIEKDENMENEYYEDFDNLAFNKVKGERNQFSSKVLRPFNENKPEEIKIDKGCDENVREKQVRQEAVKKTFKCDQCAYRATRSAHLNRHLLIHTRRKPFVCDQCDYRGTRLSFLVSHKANKRSETFSLCSVYLLRCNQCKSTAAHFSNRLSQVR